MGAWGIESFENDTALDFVSELLNFKSLKNLLKKKQLTHDDYDRLRVSAVILLHLHKIHNLWCDQEIIDLMIIHLEFMSKDQEWFDTWTDDRDARDIRKQVKKLIKGLKEIQGY